MAPAKTTADDLQWQQEGVCKTLLQLCPTQCPASGLRLLEAGLALEKLRPELVLGRSANGTRVLLVCMCSNAMQVTISSQSCQLPQQASV